MRGNFRQRLILGDASARQVLRPSLDLAPCRNGLQPPQHVSLFRLDLDPVPGVFGVHGIISWIGELFHLLVKPLASSGLLQLFEHAGENNGKMGNIGNRIIDLAPVERTARPVGKARALVEAQPKPAFDQIGIAELFGLRERHGTNLRIENRMRGLAGEIVDDLDILPTSVKHLEHILALDQQIEQRFEIDVLGQRIDRRVMLRRRHLNEAKFRIIGRFAHEFGIDGDERRVGYQGAELRQCGAVGDQQRGCHRPVLGRKLPRMKPVAKRGENLAVRGVRERLP